MRKPTPSIAEPQLEIAFLMPHVDAALAQLASADRDALVLRFLQQQSMAMVSQSLGVSEEAAKKRVARALTRLRNIFFRDRGVITNGVLATTLGSIPVVASSGPSATAVTAAALSAAKGAAADGSSQSFAQGAMKAMLRAKLRYSAIAAIALICIFAATALVIRVTSRQSNPPAAAPALADARDNHPGGVKPSTINVLRTRASSADQNTYEDIVANNYFITPVPFEKQQIADLLKRLKSGDKTQVASATTEVETVIGRNKLKGFVSLTADFLPALIKAEKFDVADDLAKFGILTVPYDVYDLPIAFGVRIRVAGTEATRRSAQIRAQQFQFLHHERHRGGGRHAGRLPEGRLSRQD